MHACAYASNASVCPSVHPSVCHLTNPLKFCVTQLCRHILKGLEYFNGQTQNSHNLSRNLYNYFGYLNRVALIPDGRYSNFFSYGGLGPASTFQKKNQEFQTPYKIFEILAAQKISPILMLFRRLQTVNFWVFKQAGSNTVSYRKGWHLP